MAAGTAALREGRLADALVIAEGLVRRYGSGAAGPAALRARVLETCGSPLATRAWDAAWSCDPESAALQDAMLQAWANIHSGRSVASLGASFLPLRCREGTHESLLRLLRRCGVTRVGACWPDATGIAGMCFDLESNAAGPAMATIVAATETEEIVVSVPLDGTPFHIDTPQAGVWSVAFAPQAEGSRPQILQGSPVSFAESLVTAAGRPRKKAAREVDVIIPVYKDRAAVRTCIKSVLASLPQNRTPARVIVVDDASPDAGVSAWLDGLASSGWITLLRNRFNLGFIEAVNRALRHSDTRDALLLNSDTEVFGNWIDRLGAALDGAQDVASVMPWSNNGEIANLWPAPGDRDREAPPSSVAAQIDAHAAALSAAGKLQDLEIPTCSGFAMLMRREALREAGLLDGAALTRGYLEEVDWCLRARAKGWRHLLAAGVFVTHHGSSSFGAEKVLRVRQNRAVIAARYPGYYDEYARFLASDELEHTRAPLLRALREKAVQWPLPDSSKPLQTRSMALAALPSSCARVAVRIDRESPSGASQQLLVLARKLAAANSRLRLLVFGPVNEAVRHTGVVDVVPSDEELGRLLRLIGDAELMQLCGCTELIDLTQPAASFDPQRWLAARGLLAERTVAA